MACRSELGVIMRNRFLWSRLGFGEALLQEVLT